MKINHNQPRSTNIHIDQTISDNFLQYHFRKINVKKKSTKINQAPSRSIKINHNQAVCFFLPYDFFVGEKVWKSYSGKSCFQRDCNLLLEQGHSWKLHETGQMRGPEGGSMEPWYAPILTCTLDNCSFILEGVHSNPKRALQQNASVLKCNQKIPNTGDTESPDGCG